MRYQHGRGASLWSGAAVVVEALESRRLMSVVPAGFVDETVATGLELPTRSVILPDGRILVTEQGGALRVVKGGHLVAAPALTLDVNSQGERGLIGITIDPNFSSNQFIYLYYTTGASPVHNRVSRFTMSGDTVLPGSEDVLMNLDPLGATSHNGGGLQFGPDGKLYVGVGENTIGANAQSLSTRLGKMLRINADGSIPTDNPFVNQTTDVNQSIWALGLRNPYSFAFQPGTGQMLINDVGLSSFEEIDPGIVGANYGWPITEGPTTDPRFVSPVFSYDHSDGSSAITSGVFYNPTNATFPQQFFGDYFFTDLTGGYIKTLAFSTIGGPVTVSPFATGLGTMVDLEVSDNGDLYYLEIQEGELHRIRFAGEGVPVITGQPASQSVAAGKAATFTVAAVGAGTLAYQWQRNGVDIPGAHGTSFTLPGVSASDSGAVFRAVVTSSAGSVTSDPATLTVTEGKAPVVTITKPAAGATFDAGKKYTFAARAKDAKGKAVAAKGFKWQVEFVDNGVVTPVSTVAGKQKVVVAVPAGQTSTTGFYRVTLTVTDAGGGVKTVVRDFKPHVVKVTVKSAVGGLTVSADGGTAGATPVTFSALAGSRHTVETTTPQVLGEVTYDFTRWSDGVKKASRPLVVPPRAVTLVAGFKKRKG